MPWVQVRTHAHRHHRCCTQLGPHYAWPHYAQCGVDGGSRFGELILGVGLLLAVPVIFYLLGAIAPAIHDWAKERSERIAIEQAQQLTPQEAAERMRGESRSRNTHLPRQRGVTEFSWRLGMAAGAQNASSRSVAFINRE